MEILKTTEAIPSAYPPVPSGLSTAAAALDGDAIWARIENYISFRWSGRQVIWIVKGPGDWVPSLTPATVTVVELWQSLTWATVTLEPTPTGGLCLPGSGEYRFTADVGSGTVPAEVDQAFRRLAEYMAETPERQGAGRYDVSIGGEISESFDRSATWVARAMANSGAGDLLRSYRRV